MLRPRIAGGVILGITIGMALGVGMYTFVYARGYSYMTDNAEACVNCHIMQEQFSGWLKSSHRAVAVCNDCHTPPGANPQPNVTAPRNSSRRTSATTSRGARSRRAAGTPGIACGSSSRGTACRRDRDERRGRGRARA